LEDKTVEVGDIQSAQKARDAISVAVSNYKAKFQN
jgi:hypothetical protein